MDWVDSHNHMASLKYKEIVDLVIKESIESGVSSFIQGGLDSADWKLQADLKRRHPKNIHCVYGLHPYRAALMSDEDIDLELDKLSRVISNSVAVGELGLDFRSQILAVDGHTPDQIKDRQFYAFQNQLELAQNVFHKPIVLHVVRAHSEAIFMLDQLEIFDLGGVVHSFSKGWDLAKKYLNLGLKISIGSAVTFPQNKDLQDCIKNIDLNQLVLETDSPDQPIFETTGLNYPKNLIIIAQRVAQIKNIHYKSVLEVCSENARLLFKI